MTTFSVSLGDLFCTPLDVRMQSSLILSKIEDIPQEEFDSILDDEINSHIIHASGIVLGSLEGQYGGASALKATAPYSNKPQRNRDNITKLYLSTVAISTLAVTEQWTLKMLTPPDGATYAIKFEAEGSISGNQGIGNNDIILPSLGYFTSTNEFIRILASAWVFPISGEISQDSDRIYFSTYTYKPIIVTVTAWLAAGNLLNSKLSEMAPNSSSLGGSLIKRAMDLLKDLANPNKSGLTLSSIPTLSIDTIAISSKGINALGKDGTDRPSGFETEEFDEGIGFSG